MGSDMKNVAVLLGSLSENSINKTLAKAIEKLAEGRREMLAAMATLLRSAGRNPPLATFSKASPRSAVPHGSLSPASLITR